MLVWRLKSWMRGRIGSWWKRSKDAPVAKEAGQNLWVDIGSQNFIFSCFDPLVLFFSLTSGVTFLTDHGCYFFFKPP